MRNLFCSQDVRALVLLEFDYLCAQGIGLRRCTHRVIHFILFLSHSHYCDRLVADTEKSCFENGEIAFDAFTKGIDS